MGSTLSRADALATGWAGTASVRPMDCYETALSYAKEREQFGQPIASFQLVQAKLVEMVNKISLSQLLSIHVEAVSRIGANSTHDTSRCSR